MYYRYHLNLTGSQNEWEDMMNRPLVHVNENLGAEFSNPAMSSLWSEQLIKTLLKPQNANCAQALQDTSANGFPLQGAKTWPQGIVNQKAPPVASEHKHIQTENLPHSIHHIGTSKHFWKSGTTEE